MDVTLGTRSGHPRDTKLYNQSDSCVENQRRHYDSKNGVNVEQPNDASEALNSATCQKA